MSWEVILMGVVAAAAGWVYVHFSGRHFDRKYLKSGAKTPADQTRAASR